NRHYPTPHHTIRAVPLPGLASTCPRDKMLPGLPVLLTCGTIVQVTRQPELKERTDYDWVAGACRHFRVGPHHFRAQQVARSGPILRAQRAGVQEINGVG